jgi:hypothetical protein
MASRRWWKKPLRRVTNARRGWHSRTADMVVAPVAISPDGRVQISTIWRCLPKSKTTAHVDVSQEPTRVIVVDQREGVYARTSDADRQYLSISLYDGC